MQVLQAFQLTSLRCSVARCFIPLTNSILLGVSDHILAYDFRMIGEMGDGREIMKREEGREEGGREEGRCACR